LDGLRVRGPAAWRAQPDRDGGRLRLRPRYPRHGDQLHREPLDGRARGPRPVGRRLARMDHVQPAAAGELHEDARAPDARGAAGTRRRRRMSARQEKLLLRVCVLSLFAGLIHGIVSPDHFAEWWGYGVFFIVAAFAQAGYGAIPLFRRMVEDESVLVGWSRPKLRAFLWVGIAGNCATLLLWLVTRTVGIPFFGPEAGK